MNLLGSKKGQVGNYFAVILFLFLFGFMSILGYLLMTEMIDAYRTVDVWNPEMAAAADGFLRALQVIDYLMVIILVALIIGVGVTSYKINAPPIYFVVSVIMSAFLAITSWIFNYIFQQLVSPTIFNATLAYFPITILICQNFHWIALVTFTVGSITLYAKKEEVNLVQQ